MDGRYELRVTPGTYSLKIKYISYKEVELTGVVVKASETTFQNIWDKYSSVMCLEKHPHDDETSQLTSRDHRE